MASLSSNAASGSRGEKRQKQSRWPSLPSFSSCCWLFVVVAMAGVVAPASAAEVYMVGDKVGWTILGSPNYTAWTFSKNFKNGDIIVFQYNKQFHNVVQVSKADYKACSAASPIATHTTGNDSITLTRRGHYFFICGVPGHCDAGQKVDIRIPKLSSSSSPSPSPAAAAATTTGRPSSASPSPASDVGTAGSNAVAPPLQNNRSAAAAGPTVGWTVGVITSAIAAASLFCAHLMD